MAPDSAASVIADYAIDDRTGCAAHLYRMSMAGQGMVYGRHMGYGEAVHQGAHRSAFGKIDHRTGAGSAWESCSVKNRALWPWPAPFSTQPRTAYPHILARSQGHCRCCADHSPA